ncbi:hypothetical protein T492DRAFT_1089912 [Pavlovales sp. CCMP2436]|nr:hypothetical protein T492DRAFT_1089912 [Pavlovales sp. CCMP2436]
MLLLGGGATEHVRLKIGESIGTVAPSFLSATVAIFTAPDGAAGAPSIVAIALNGQDFEAASDGGGGVPTFSFTGYHPPKLTSAAFSNDLGTLVLSFDAQPTDRASMAGVASCARLLSADSVAALVGASNINDTKVFFLGLLLVAATILRCTVSLLLY